MINFKDFNLNESMLKSLKLMNFDVPTEVQEKVIPLALSGDDIIVKAQTGSGKTAAFAIPIIENLIANENAVQALVLTPTRELAVQVQETFSTLGVYKKIKTVAVYGKQPMSIQKNQLSQRVHIVVGTPGRTLDHIEKGNLDISSVKYLIIDEADEMLNMGFIDEVENIIKKVPKLRQTLMFSATLSYEIKELINKYMFSPKLIELTPETLTVAKINQKYYEIDENLKYNLLEDLIKTEDITKAILFCRTKKNVAYLASRMRVSSYSVTEIHGDMLQNDRLSALKAFKEDKFQFIVATDVAARGIDVNNVSHVFNYDIPLELEAYVHRIGRTGRAGSSGEAITFVTRYEDKFLKAIEEFINMKIPQGIHPSKEEVLNAPKKEFKPSVAKINNKSSDIIKIHINGGKKKKIRRGDIVASLIHSGGVPADDIGVIDIFDTYSYVDILNGSGKKLLSMHPEINLKGKSIKIQRAKK
ncbi:DEAD/DEAH box helicase [Clostridium cellulovorans]|uniref:DEAD/DEAH box helicase domain protein n=1 Tax=Clostridium cellulovorans (strain ATCC 35296 / DSM 3052 / OCM 3 / 743B) TaxID=573061 RepID=D9SSA7_CLOC7|nr:DEAD/DEAH box helicase [Clostridium cellulovorans]ADL52554.1 DEAD/DEAH box helicase domain protein [Clostridium cellulovorans 743B]